MSPGKTVLLVEDDGPTRDALTLMLCSEGHTVLAACNGREALELLHGASRPDLIVLDLMMPVLSGWEFREHQRRDPAVAGIPVIVLSAAVRVAEKSTDLGDVAYVQKPIAPEGLLPLVRRFTSAAS